MHDWILKQETPVDLGVAEEQAASLAGVDLGVIQDVVGGIDVSNQMRADIFTKNRVWRKSNLRTKIEKFDNKIEKISRPNVI